MHKKEEAVVPSRFSNGDTNSFRFVFIADTNMKADSGFVFLHGALLSC
jgi:hypothetical protein